MAKAQGQITLVDLNDAVALTGYITANMQTTQIYNPDNGSYNPDWAKTNIKLTASLYVAGGGSTDQITSSAVQSVTWYEGDSASPITSSVAGGDPDTGYTISGTKGQILAVRRNITTADSGKNLRCVVSYKDPASGLTVTTIMGIALARVTSGSGMVMLQVYAPGGNIFKNGEVESVQLKAELWRGSVIDTSNVDFQWYKLDPSAEEDEGGGEGWKKLTDVPGKYANTAKDTLTIYPDGVDSYDTFKCVATDTDETSSTHSSTFSGVHTVTDQSDPVYVDVQCEQGTVFKNGQGVAKQLNAVVYRGGQQVTPKSYSWARYKNGGVKDPSFSSSVNPLVVTSSQVDVQDTFVCTVEV